MNRFLLEILKKYTKIVKIANLIGFLNRLAVSTSFAYFGQNYKKCNRLVNPLTEIFSGHIKHISSNRLFPNFIKCANFYITTDLTEEKPTNTQRIS